MNYNQRVDQGDRQRLVGAAGFLVLQFIGWLFSVHPGKVMVMVIMVTMIMMIMIIMITE